MIDSCQSSYPTAAIKQAGGVAATNCARAATAAKMMVVERMLMVISCCSSCVYECVAKLVVKEWVGC